MHSPGRHEEPIGHLSEESLSDFVDMITFVNDENRLLVLRPIIVGVIDEIVISYARDGHLTYS